MNLCKTKGVSFLMTTSPKIQSTAGPLVTATKFLDFFRCHCR
jgi:hypothetical protein